MKTVGEPRAELECMADGTPPTGGYGTEPVLVADCEGTLVLLVHDEVITAEPPDID